MYKRPCVAPENLIVLAQIPTAQQGSIRSPSSPKRDVGLVERGGRHLHKSGAAEA